MIFAFNVQRLPFDEGIFLHARVVRAELCAAQHERLFIDEVRRKCGDKFRWHAHGN